MKDTSLSPPFVPLCPLSEWAHKDVSHTDRCPRCTQTIPIPAVTSTLAQTIADVPGPFPASAFIHSGICVSLFVLVKWAGRAGRPCHVYPAPRRGFKLGLWTNNIKHFQEENVGIEGKITSQVCFL